MKRRLTYSLCISSALLITSCGTTKLSKMDINEVDAGRKAIVRADNKPLWAEVLFPFFPEKPIVHIEAVDGKEIDTELFNLNDRIVLDVGMHTVEFRCSDRADHEVEDRTQIIELDLKPHHEYLVDCWLESGFNVEEKSLE